MPIKIVKSEFVYSVPSVAQMRDFDDEVAVIGRSNSGKSSLINAIGHKRDLARTSKTPGRTRHAVVYSIEISRRKNGHLTLVDLPGFGFASMSKTEAAACEELIFSYLTTRQKLRLIILLIDIRRKLDERERQIIAIAKDRLIPLLLVLTKSDKIALAKRKPAITAMMRDVDLPREDIMLHSTSDVTTTAAVQERIFEY